MRRLSRRSPEGAKADPRNDHVHNEDKDGRETNAALETILNAPPAASDTLEAEYERFCASVRIATRKAPFGITRKFWDLR